MAMAFKKNDRARKLLVYMTPVGFEPTQLALVELESTPLDHSGKVSLIAGIMVSMLPLLKRGGE